MNRRTISYFIYFYLLKKKDKVQQKSDMVKFILSLIYLIKEYCYCLKQMKTQKSEYSQVSQSQSFHHFKILQDHLNKLEQRVHKIYKNQKNIQKNVQLQNEQYKLDQQQTNKSISELTVKIKKIQQSLHSKYSENKNDIDKHTQIKKQIRSNIKTIQGAFDRKLQQLRIQIKKQIRSNDIKERTSVNKKDDHNQKLQKQISTLKESFKKANKQITLIRQQLQQTKLILQKQGINQSRCFNQSLNQQKTDELQRKFTTKMEQGMNAMQQIIKKYIDDQANILLKMKNIQNRLHIKQNQKIKQQISKAEFGRQSFAPLYQQSGSKTANSNFFKNESKVSIEGYKKISRQSSTKRIQNSNIKQEDRSYSSKKISDLKEKLKQFEMINDKYQKQKDVNYDQINRNSKNSVNSLKIPLPNNIKQNQELNSYGLKTQNNYNNNMNEGENKNAIDKLKQFKYLLQNTQSQMDISNTFNNQIVGLKQNNYNEYGDQKYKKLERVYENINRQSKF